MAANGHVYNPDSADEWKEQIMAAFIACRTKQITEPVHLKVYFFMPVPKGMKIERKNDRYVPHIKKPDMDNLLKAVMDSLTQIRVWKDDSLAFWTEAAKFYASDTTGAEIIIETFQEGK
jgi:Holliday junction resolvase RusA-like endonuclease